MQKIWSASSLQRRQFHQKPPDGSQGQRSYIEEEWSHL